MAHVAVRLAAILLAALALFGTAHWLREIFVLECQRAGNTAPTCELGITRRGSTTVTAIASGDLIGAKTEHRRVYDNDGSFADHFHLAVITRHGTVMSSSGNSQSDVDTAVRTINAFIATSSSRQMTVSLDNALMCYGIAAFMSLMTAYIIHQLRH